MPQQDPGSSTNPPSKLPEVTVALMRVQELRGQLAQMTETLNNLEVTIINIGTKGKPESTDPAGSDT